MFNEEERQSVVKNYNELSGFSPVEEETTETSTETEEVADDSTETEEQTETSAESEETESSEEDTTETAEDDTTSVETEEKMVPYGALHEEREKRKALSRKVSETEEKLNQVIQDYRQLVETKETEQTEYSDPELEMMRREIADLRKFKDQMTQKSQQQEAMELEKSVEQKVDALNEKLDKEGFPFFKEMLTPVQLERARRIKDDPDSFDFYSSPEGWEKIFKETVFPKINTKIKAIHKTDLFEKKQELKSGQKLVTKTGQKTPTEKKDKEWSYEDYMKHRKATSLA